MECLCIKGGRRLGGEMAVHGAKNSVLPILAATILIKGECVLHNCPRLSDVKVTVDILRYLGADVKREGDALIVNASALSGYDIPEKLMREMRSSIVFLGALAARVGKACVYLPGGCEIGLRPIDMHLKGLQALGCQIEMEAQNVCCYADNAKAAKVVLPFPSVGATENIILASVLLEGKTTIVNAAREPEIEDLCAFLNKAGARIYGASTPVIEIEGVASLHSAEHTIIPDRILASTLMCMAAATGSELRLNNLSLTHLEPVLPVFDAAGCKLYLSHHSLLIKAPKRLKAVRSIETRPYPGFPTDCQAPLCAMLSIAGGVSVIKETIFENRFMHIPQLLRFGADMNVYDRTAVIHGVRGLHASEAECTDLRGGAAVVTAALCAEGTSVIKHIHHIDRGYESIERQLSAIGADIKRINYEEGKNKENKGENAQTERAEK